MKTHSIRRILAWVAVAVAVVAVCAPVATAVPIDSGRDNTRLTADWSKAELKRISQARAKKVRNNRSAVKRCIRVHRQVATRNGRCLIDEL
jgi:hypothetical protein